MADTLVLTVSASQSFDNDLPILRYPNADAQRFSRAMHLAGLVKPAYNQQLLDASSQQVVERLQYLQNRFKGRLKKVIFYFSGHGDDRGLHFKDSAIPQSQLQNALAKFASDLSLTIVDSCYAGGALGKGVELVRNFGQPAMEIDEPTGHILLSASQPAAFAYESQNNQGGLFTHNLINGLYGKADSNADGIVTVSEIYLYSYRETKLASLNLPFATTQRPWFKSQLQGSGAVALAYPARGSGTLNLAPEIDGEIIVYNQIGRRQTSLLLSASSHRQITLPHGRYSLVRYARGHRQAAPVAIAVGENQHLSMDDFNKGQTLYTAVARGGQPHRPRQLSVLVGYTQPPDQRYSSGAAFKSMLTLQQAQFLNQPLNLSADLGAARLTNRSEYLNIFTAGLAASIEGPLFDSPWSMGAYLSVGGAHLFQRSGGAFATDYRSQWRPMLQPGIRLAYASSPVQAQWLLMWQRSYIPTSYDNDNSRWLALNSLLLGIHQHW